ncbi:MAG: hypothetical protein WB626_05265 [Bacteroidota bacterium]
MKPLPFLLLPSLLCAWAGCLEPEVPPLSPPLPTGGYSVVGRVRTPGAAQDVVVRDTLAFVAQGEGGLAVLTVADPRRPALMTVLQEGVRGYATKIAIKDSAVYVGSGTFGIQVVDVANPREPYTTVENLGIRPARSLLVFGNFLFASASELGVRICEVGFPTQPDLRGGMRPPGYARGMAFTPDSSRLLVACGELGLAVFDISEMQDGWGNYRQLAWLDLPGYAEDVAVAGTEPFALLACGTAGLQVVRFSDSSGIVPVSFLETGGYAKEIAWRDGTVFMSAETRGLQIISVGDPSAPRLAGVVETEYALGLTLEGERIFLADESEGLLVIARQP